MTVNICNPESVVFDHNDLVSRCMGSVELVERILRRFQTTFSEDLNSLDRGLRIGDASQVVRLAHRLKGSAANAAAPKLKHRAAAIEDLGREERLTEATAQLEDLRGEWIEFLEQASQLLAD